MKTNEYGDQIIENGPINFEILDSENQTLKIRLG